MIVSELDIVDNGENHSNDEGDESSCTEEGTDIWQDACLILLGSLHSHGLVGSIMSATKSILGFKIAQSNVAGTTHSLLRCCLESYVVCTAHVVGAALVIVGAGVARLKFGLKTFPDVGNSDVMCSSHVV